MYLPLGCSCITNSYGTIKVYDPLCGAPTTFGHKSKAVKRKPKAFRVKVAND